MSKEIKSVREIAKHYELTQIKTGERIVNVIEKAIEDYKQQFQYDFSKSCGCGESSPGATWCCNRCGLPTSNKFQSPVTDEMTKYILEIDALTTKQFCEKFSVPLPVFTNEVESIVNQLLQIDAIKHRMFVQKAKELNKPNS